MPRLAARLGAPSGSVRFVPSQRYARGRRVGGAHGARRRSSTLDGSIASLRSLARGRFREGRYDGVRG